MMNIILVGYAATEAAHRLILNERPALSCRFSDRFINNSFEITRDSFVNIDSINSIINKSGIKVSDEDIMELSDMGVFGGLWEFADRIGCGIKIYLDKINIRQETVEICEYLNVNPYTYPSQGSWIIRTDKAYELTDFINNMANTSCDCKDDSAVKEKMSMIASVIGTETDDKDRIILNQGEIRFLTPIDRLLSDEQGIKNLRYIK